MDLLDQSGSNIFVAASTTYTPYSEYVINVIQNWSKERTISIQTNKQKKKAIHPTLSLNTCHMQPPSPEIALSVHQSAAKLPKGLWTRGGLSMTIN